MHSTDNNSLFSAWSEAERRARDAERRLYELILTQGGQPPSREDVEQARALRERASELLLGMLEGLREESVWLRGGRGDPDGGSVHS